MSQYDDLEGNEMGELHGMHVDKLRAEVARLRESEKRLVEALEAAENVISRVSFEHLCDAVHHDMQDRHPVCSACPVVSRAMSALDLTRAALAAATGDKP